MLHGVLAAFIYFFIFILFRIENCLQTIEGKHCIAKRWHQSDVVFQSTMKVLDWEVRGQLLLRARTEARERVTLLHLKGKYPGKIHFSKSPLIMIMKWHAFDIAIEQMIGTVSPGQN